VVRQRSGTSIIEYVWMIVPIIGLALLLSGAKKLRKAAGDFDENF
jgi:Sec-independent protein translocase protein TatA